MIKNKPMILISIVALATWAQACTVVSREILIPISETPISTDTTLSTDSQIPTLPKPTPILPTPTSQLSGPYLGQEPPGMEPKIFAPGIISDPDFSEFSGAFSTDGSEYYFYRFSESSQSKIFYSKIVDGIWTAPEQLAVTAGFAAYQPFISVDNHWLYFAWDHPIPAGEPRTGVPAYFGLERTQEGWSEPIYAGQGMFISSSQDGQLYTTDMSSFSMDRKTFLAKISVMDGRFISYERLPLQIPWGNPAHPCIALDGSYILFDIEGSHLFISFQNTDGTWGDLIDLAEHGFDSRAAGAYISPDGKYLFFALAHDIWWVDISVIENLKPTKSN